MKLVIERREDSIAVAKNFSNCRGRGDIASMMAEIDVIKMELLVLYDEWKQKDDGEVTIEVDEDDAE